MGGNGEVGCLLTVITMLVLVFDFGNCNFQQFEVDLSIRSKAEIRLGDAGSVRHRDPRSVHRSRRSVLNSTEQDEVLAAHNRVRRLEGGSNMEIMIWDNSLARIAETSALTCIWNHSNSGQNLYSRDGSDAINLTKAVDAWYDEKRYYNNYYLTQQCNPSWEPCLHYSQVVWATSRKLGCAYTRCQTLQLSNLTNALLLVCNYDPPGNVIGIGQKPYQTGTGCSRCTNGSWWCNEGLCDGRCSGTGPMCGCAPVCLNFGSVNGPTCSCSCTPGWYGSDCSDVCENKDSQCDPKPGTYGYPPSYCTDSTNGPTVRQLCPKMCNVCQPADNNHSTSMKPTLLNILSVWLSCLLIYNFRSI